MSRLPQRVCDGVKKAVMDNYSISKLGVVRGAIGGQVVFLCHFSLGDGSYSDKPFVRPMKLG